MKLHFFPVAVGALALAACGGDATTDATTDQTTAQDTAMTDTGEAEAIGSQEFVATVAASDQYEIEAGRLASERGTSQSVRDFGAMMVEDHTRSTESLRNAAQADGLSINPQPTQQKQADLEALRNAGDNFDQVYAQQQVAAHQETLDLLRRYAENGESGALRTFASDTAAVVEGHLEQARRLP